MKKIIVIAAMALSFSNVYAGTDHYVLKDGGFVRHLKVTQNKDDYTVTADVDFESTGNEESKEHCSINLSSPAKSAGANELLVKKHSESAASFCELKIHLSPTGAKIEQASDCVDFTVGKCSFSSDGKELLKLK